jgi:hypothetical protein
MTSYYITGVKKSSHNPGVSPDTTQIGLHLLFQQAQSRKTEKIDQEAANVSQHKKRQTRYYDIYNVKQICRLRNQTKFRDP